MKIDKVIVHTANEMWELNMVVDVSSELLKSNIKEVTNIGLPIDYANYPIIMSVIHELIADIAEKSGNTFDNIVNDMKEIELRYPATGDIKGRIHYENA